MRSIDLMGSMRSTWSDADDPMNPWDQGQAHERLGTTPRSQSIAFSPSSMALQVHRSVRVGVGEQC